MAPFVFAVVILATFIMCAAWMNRGGGGVRTGETLLLACIVCGVELVAITELLSLVSGLTFAGIALSWAAVTAVTAAVAGALIRRRGFPRLTIVSYPLDRGEKAMLAGCAFIAGAGFILALAAPSNNWDSLSYHMPRIMRWALQKNLAFYPVATERQLWSSVWAEFAILHSYILSGGDRYANLVQWFSMAGSAVCITLIAGQLGMERKSRIAAALVLAAIPMGVLESSTTQTDYTVTFWTLCFVVFFLRFTGEEGSRRDGAASAGALGLAVAAKATAFVFAAPFFAVFGLQRLMQRQSRRSRGSFALWLAVMVLFTALLNSGHFARNYSLYGSPLGDDSPYSGHSSYHIVNTSHRPMLVLSNIIRNLSLHTGLPGKALSDRELEALRSLHSRLGLDADDKRITYGPAFTINPASRQETDAGNPLHLALIIASFLVLPFFGYSHNRRRIMLYALSAALGFFLFCYLLRWQPLGSRLHLPFFAISAPLIPLALSKLSRPQAAAGILLCLFLYALPFALCSVYRPLTGTRCIVGALELMRFRTGAGTGCRSVLAENRTSIYFNRSGREREYREVMAYLAAGGCSQVGLVIGDNDPEYLFWVLAKETPGTPFVFQHVNVAGPSSAAASNSLYNSFVPCAVVAYDSNAPETVTVRGATFHTGMSNGFLRVYKAEK